MPSILLLVSFGFLGLAFALAVLFVVTKAWRNWQTHRSRRARVLLKRAALRRDIGYYKALARRFVLEAYDVLGELLQDSHPMAQDLFRAAGGLKRVHRLSRSRVVRHRVQAAALLARLPFFDESSTILCRLVADPHPLVREAAARAVAIRRDAPAAAAMLRAIERYNDLSMYRVARHALARCGHEVTNGLIEGLSSELPEVRWLCLDVLGDIGDPVALPVILALARRDGDTETLTRLARALRSYSGVQVVQCLLDLAGHPEWQVRAQAARSLGLVAGRDGNAIYLDAVLECLEQLTRDQEYWVRNNAATALASLGEPGRRILQRLASGSDRYAAERAREALQVLGEV